MLLTLLSDWPPSCFLSMWSAPMYTAITACSNEVSTTCRALLAARSLLESHRKGCEGQLDVCKLASLRSVAGLTSQAIPDRCTIAPPTQLATSEFVGPALPSILCSVHQFYLEFTYPRENFRHLEHLLECMLARRRYELKEKLVALAGVWCKA